MSAAERLIHFLENDPRCSYVALYAEFDSALLAIPNQRPRLVSVKRASGRDQEKTPIPQNQNDTFWDEMEANARNAEGTTTQEVDDLVDEIDSAKRQAMRIRRALCLSDCKKLLLGLAWTFDAARETLTKFPEATASDITEGTNAEKRPTMMTVCKDANNRICGVTWAYLPSKCRWVFGWYFSMVFTASSCP